MKEKYRVLGVQQNNWLRWRDKVRHLRGRDTWVVIGRMKTLYHILVVMT